jgi:hypothetical protein
MGGLQLRAERGREVAKYGDTTRTKLDYIISSQWLDIGFLNFEDLERLWELVQAAEGLDTVTNPVHARQRLRKALEALREDNRLAAPSQEG